MMTASKAAALGLCSGHGEYAVMIIYNPKSAIDMMEFGIGVAHSGSRASKILAAVKSRNGLGEREREWLYDAPIPPLTREDLLRVHSPEYVKLLLSDSPEPAICETYELLDENGNYHRYDPEKAARPLSGIVDRTLEQMAGSYMAARRAMENGFCFFLGGGMHHAYRDRGRGFCLLNDVVIAMRRMRAEGRARRFFVIDVDCHRGDGTAALCLDDPDALTLSIHTANGWPLDEPPLDASGALSLWRYPGDVDIPVPENAEDRYLPALEKGLALLEELAFGQPCDMGMVVAGADPYVEDELKSASGIRLSLEQMLERDMFVYQWLRERNLPQCWVMAGGYGENAWKPHANFISNILPGLLGERAKERS